MKEFTIMTDTASDLSDRFQEEYGIRVLSAHLTLPDNSEIDVHTRWDQFTKEEFYRDLKKNPDGYKTSPANAAEIAEAVKEEVKAGRGVLFLAISSAISGSYGFACQAKAMVLETYPDAVFNIVDTLRFGPGFGLMCVYASIQRSAGMDLAETTAWVEENKNRFHQAGWLDDLSFVAKKGRLTHAKAFFGTLAGVKPIGEFDYNGLTTVLGKASGAKAAYTALLEYMEKTIEKPEEQIIFVAETNRLPQAEEYKRLIEERFHPKAVYITEVFPTCGVNVGPGLMAAYYQGREISKDLSEERAILEQALAK